MEKAENKYITVAYKMYMVEKPPWSIPSSSSPAWA